MGVIKMVVLHEAWWEELNEFIAFLHKVFSMTFKIANAGNAALKTILRYL